MNSVFKKLALLAGLASSAAALQAADSASVWLTAKDSPARLARQPELSFAPLAQPTEQQQCVFVDPSKQFQEIIGIGGALTDAAAETFYKLPEAKRRELLRAYYDPVDGIGYSLGRTHINSCDFSSERYAYVQEGDRELKSFSVAHDEKYRIPFIREALAAAGGKLTLYASPWSPPAWMKDNKDTLHGGKLLADCADAWARYYVRFIQAYAKAGIPIWGVTVQNEPMAKQKWESCIFTAEEERDFVKNHLGPVFAKAGMADRKIVVWDHNRTMMYQRAQTILDDPAAAKFVWGVAYHWYVNDSFENVKRVQEAYPSTHLLFTEGCTYPFDFAKLGEWKYGEQYGLSMVNDFNNGAVGWTDWNVLLDETGGPNHVANFCFAPVHGDTRTGELHYMSSFYYIGHFSKFVRPGARRIISSATIDTLATTAFQNADGSIVVVVVNRTDAAQPFAVSLRGRVAPTTSPAHSILTVVIPASK